MEEVDELGDAAIVDVDGAGQAEGPVTNLAQDGRSEGRIRITKAWDTCSVTKEYKVEILRLLLIVD